MIIFKGGCDKLYYIQRILLSNVRPFFLETNKHTPTHRGEGNVF